MLIAISVNVLFVVVTLK